MRKFIVFATFVLSIFISGKVNASTLPANFSSTNVATVDLPTAMEIAPDGRIFVLEKAGNIRVIKNGVLLSTAFGSVSVDTNGERGLLGIAFDPNFNINQYVYVYYISTGFIPTVRRFTASGDTATDGGTDIIQFDIMNNATNHNGGGLHFADDGKLLLAIGENGNSNNALLLTNTRGKILRFNSDGTIPSDNPFYGSLSGNNRAIYAYGLRNPFTFAMDPLDKKIYVNDVGDTTWEEINQLQAGGNYGWVNCEGGKNHGTNTDCTFPSVAPLYYYNHTTGDVNGNSIAGGAFYRGNNFPSEYSGKYFFGDYVDSWIKVYDTTSNTVSNFGTNFSGVVDLKVGQDGALYVANINTGKIERIIYDNGSEPPVPVITAPANGDHFSGLDTINFSGTASDTEDGALANSAFSWDISFHKGSSSQPYLEPFVGVSSGSFQIPNTTVSTPDIFYRVTLTVTDSDNHTVSTFKDIAPNLVHLSFSSDYMPNNLNINGTDVQLPYSFDTVVNFEQSFQVPLFFASNVSTYKFSAWSNAGSRIQTINAPASDTAYVATYNKVFDDGTWNMLNGIKVASTESIDFNDKIYQTVVDTNGFLKTRITDGSVSGNDITWTTFVASGATDKGKVYFAKTVNRLYQSVVAGGYVWSRATDGTLDAGQPIWTNWNLSGGTNGDIVMKGLSDKLFQSVEAGGFVYTRTTDGADDGLGNTIWSTWSLDGASTTGKVFMEATSNRLYQSRIVNNLVWTRNADSSLVWSDWVMSGGTNGEVYFGVLGNRIYQSVVADGYVWTRNGNGTTWSGWILSGGTNGKIFFGTSNGRTYQTVIASTYVWTRSTDGTILSENTVWGPWILSGNSDKDVFMINLQNNLFQFIVTSDGFVWQRSTDNSLDGLNNPQWTNWVLSGGGKGKLSLSVINNVLIESVIASNDLWSRFIK
ncbi:MAG: PQQ-dependent sugar dehydrogenase [Candidatus Dojkabacteria bacterium]